MVRTREEKEEGTPKDGEVFLVRKHAWEHLNARVCELEDEVERLENMLYEWQEQERD